MDILCCIFFLNLGVGHSHVVCLSVSQIFYSLFQNLELTLGSMWHYRYPGLEKNLGFDWHQWVLFGSSVWLEGTSFTLFQLIDKYVLFHEIICNKSFSGFLLPNSMVAASEHVSLWCVSLVLNSPFSWFSLV